MNFFDQIQSLKVLQQRQSFALRFDPVQEVEFVEWVKTRQQQAAHYAVALMCIIWFIFLIADFVRLADRQEVYRALPMFELVLSIRIPVLLILVTVALWIRKKGVVYRPNLIMFAYFILALGTAVLSNIYHEHGEYHSAWIPLVLMVPLFNLPIGVIYRQSVILALGIFACLTLNYYFMLFNEENSDFTLFLFSLSICLFSGAVGGYFNEKGLRTAFVAIKMLELKTFTDPMTDLGNRRYFTEFGKRLVIECHRNNTALSFAIIDIDYFKRFNDSYGHDFGDKVLLTFADELRAVARRPLDFCIRLGGEEFGIFFNDTEVSKAFEIMQQLKHRVSTLVFETEGIILKDLTLTFSGAVAQIKPGDTLESIYIRADQLLYQAKDSGRDRVLQE